MLGEETRALLAIALVGQSSSLIARSHHWQAVHLLRGRARTSKRSTAPDPPVQPPILVAAPLSLASLLDLAVWRGRPEDLILLNERLRSLHADDQKLFGQVAAERLNDCWLE